VLTKVECPGCNGEDSWLPDGACGGCDFCPSPRRCGECDGTGQVFAADVETWPDEEEESAPDTDQATGVA
jgi:hypothetical protein